MYIQTDITYKKILNTDVHPVVHCLDRQGPDFVKIWMYTYMYIYIYECVCVRVCVCVCIHTRITPYTTVYTPCKLRHKKLQNTRTSLCAYMYVYSYTHIHTPV